MTSLSALIIGVTAGIVPAADATAQNADWHSAGSKFIEPAGSSNAGAWRSKGSVTHNPSHQQTLTNNAAWQLPNQHSNVASHRPQATMNATRQNQATSAATREPRTFSPPAHAVRMAAPAPRTANRAVNAQQHTPSSAVMQAAATTPANKSTSAAARPTTNRRPTTPRVARAPHSAQGGPYSPSTRAWQRLNMAMQQGEADLSDKSEDLPMPGASNDAGDPFVESEGGPYLEDGYGGHAHFGDGEYYPSCGPDGCGDDCGCGDECGCGVPCDCGEGVYEPGCGCACGDPACGCDGHCCNDCLCIGPGDPESCHSVRIRVPKWQTWTIHAGVQGFKGPYDQERDGGNFGFHEGVNWGAKIPYTFAGYQIGYQAVQSQLNGDENTDSEASHTQHFTTFGLYRRTKDGLQFGMAWDVLRDDRFDTHDFHQLRNELSWMDCNTGHEFGFSGTIGINKEEDEDDDEIVWQAADQYVLFYRFHGKKGGEGRFYIGGTDDADGILGSDMLLPVHDRWSVQTGFTYLIPDENNGEDGASEEAWNINLALVWHWGCAARTSHNNPYRPLFNVANNGYLIVDSRDNDD
jgi:hypothetical protein